MNAVAAIKEFQGSYRFLSNFWPSKIIFRGVEYPSVENVFQARKCMYTSDMDAFTTCSAGQAKRLGRKITLRTDWQAVKVEIMWEAVQFKFTHNEKLGDKLIATAPATITEGNKWNDTFWGVDIDTGKGQNNLGIILMQIRDSLLPKS